MRRTAITRGGRTAALTAVAALIAVVWLTPTLWLIAGSLRPGREIFASLAPLSMRTFIPPAPTLNNFVAVLTGPFRVGLFNSLIVTSASITGGIIVCAMAAFALSAMRLPARDALFAVIVFTFLIPEEVIALPLSNLFTAWGLQNTYPGLILPAVGNGVAIFLLRQFFLSIPRELVEAGRVDGAGWWTIFLRLYVPLSKPALISAGLLLFTGQWQAYLWPLLVTTRQDMFLAPIVLAQMFGEFNQTDYGQVFAAAAILSLIPAAILFGSQSYFARSVVTSGIKE